MNPLNLTSVFPSCFIHSSINNALKGFCLFKCKIPYFSKSKTFFTILLLLWLKSCNFANDLCLDCLLLRPLYSMLSQQRYCFAKNILCKWQNSSYQMCCLCQGWCKSPLSQDSHCPPLLIALLQSDLEWAMEGAKGRNAKYLLPWLLRVAGHQSADPNLQTGWKLIPDPSLQIETHADVEKGQMHHHALLKL